MLKYFFDCEFLLVLVFLKLWCVVAVPSFPSNITNIHDTQRIVGGYRCKQRFHPYMVAIFRKMGSRLIHHCGGTILAKYWVVTAAHCMQKHKPESLTIFAGADISNVNSNLNKYVQKSKVKEGFPFGEYGIRDDIALLHLEKPIHMFSNVKYVRLATKNDTGVEEACKNGLVMGWGSQYPKDDMGDPIPDKLPPHNPHLMCFNTEVLPYSYCRDKLGNTMSERSFCAYTPGKDSCQGDSGGPFMCNGIQYGIVSWGRGCAYKNFPGAYSTVSEFEEFVKQTLLENSTTKFGLSKPLLLVLFIASYLSN